MSGFRTEWTVAGDATARTITLPLYNSGTFNCVVSWGDGSADSTITSFNDADRIHTYALDGTYQVTIVGECPAWSFANAGDKLKCTDILDWGSAAAPAFGGFSYLRSGFSGCANLKSYGVTGKIIKKTGLSTLYELFYNAVIPTAIPSGLFDNCTTVTTFGSTFECNYALVSIPADIFKYCTSASSNGFNATFYRCTTLPSSGIPNDLFRFNTSASTDAFQNVFGHCYALTSINTDIFRYNTICTGFAWAFQNCTSLISTGTDTYKYNTAVASNGFKGAYLNCTALQTVTSDIFRFNTSCASFNETFSGCSVLASVPELVMKYNSSATDFTNAFKNCNKLQLNAKIFYDTGQQATRFAGKTVNFTDCFNRNINTGVQGVAPDLWNCSFTASTKTRCWGGNGNNCASLSNCADVPTTWGICPGFMIKVTVAGDDKTFTSPFPNSGTYNGTIDWGDGSAVSAITSYNDADGAKTYTNAGTYLVNYYGEIPGWSFNNAGDKLKVVDILQWGRATFHGGFQNLTGGFYGCTNLLTTGLGKVLSKSTLYNVQDLFRGCTGISSITSGIFDNCIYVTTAAYSGTFQSSGITSVVADIFKYSTGALSFASCFEGNSSLSATGTDIFRYNTACTSFASCFKSCNLLSSLSTDIFKYNTACTSFASCFEGNSSLASVSELIFKYNTLCTSFNSTFDGCIKLQQNAKIFYDTGEASTRFAGKTVDFTKCFYRTSFTGTQGVAPDIWNATMTASTKTQCWDGNGNSLTSLTNYNDIPVVWGGIVLGAFATRWTVAGNEAARTITLPLYDSGVFNCTVSWGDGSADSTITTYDDADRIHVYATDGTYKVFILGECPAWCFSGSADYAKCTDIIDWGTAGYFGGFGYLTSGFVSCPIASTGVGKIISKYTLTNLAGLFESTPITSVTPGIFDNCIYLSTSGFSSTFAGCGNLSSIDENIFKYNVSVADIGFRQTFFECYALSHVPSGLFRYNVLAGHECFYRTFYNCSDTFFTGLQSIGNDLFRYNTLVSHDGFFETFKFCNALTSVPERLFKWNVNVSTFGFYGTFEGCTKLQQNALIFYDDGEQSTRFAGKTVNFTNCFYRTSFTGTQGTAPDLWNCIYGTVTKTDCWSGAGNSITSLANYYDIPIAWGGPALGGFKLQFTVAGDATARTITLPLYDSGTFDCTVSWGDGSADSTITAYNDADRIHVYALDGTYTVEISGACPSISFNNGGDKLKLTKIISLYGVDFDGFEYLTNAFYGCSNLTEVKIGTTIKSKAALTDLSNLFKDCVNIQIVPELIFKYNINVVSFASCFEGCIKLTQNAKIFFDTGEASTRFAGKTVDFTKCFYRTSFTGTQGTAPALWTCTYGGVTKTQCWSGAGNSITSLTNYDIIPAPWGGPYISGLKLQFTVAGDATARTITLPLVDSGTFDCTVYWGDDTAESTITAYNDADRIHTFSTDGTYEVSVLGACPSLSFNNAGDKLKITGILDLSGDEFEGFEYLTGGFYGCSNLSDVVGAIKSKSALTTLENLFRNCTSLSEIPVGFFDGCTYLTSDAFKSCFYGATALESIDQNIFKYSVNASTSAFKSCFYGCTSLLEIPESLFSFNTAVTTSAFESCFYRATAITEIPELLFKNNTLASTNAFKQCFRSCTNLTTIDPNVFKYNVNASTDAFSTIFYECSSLASVPSGIFSYNTANTSFYSAFRQCNLLSSVPELLFRNNTACVSFESCFEGCTKLQQNAKIFFDTGEEATRFSGSAIDFTRCFYRSSFNGTKGTAPALWDATYAATPTKTQCWSGLGNSLVSLYNYNSIPLEWGGTYVPLEYDPANAASIFSFAFGSWEWYQAITDYNGISIEFICSVGESLDKIGYYLSAADNTFTLGIIGGADLLNCGTYVDNTWHKVKIDRLTSGVFKLYVNDILVGTSAADFTCVNSEYITMTIGESCRIALSDPLGNHGFKVSLIS